MSSKADDGAKGSLDAKSADVIVRMFWKWIAISHLMRGPQSQQFGLFEYKLLYNFVDCFDMPMKAARTAQLEQDRPLLASLVASNPLKLRGFTAPTGGDINMESGPRTAIPTSQLFAE